MSAVPSRSCPTFEVPETIQDAPVAPTELTETEMTEPASQAAARRIAVYIVAALALALVVWALIAGSDRDLSDVPAAVLYWTSG